MPLRGNIWGDDFGRPAPAPLGTGLTSVLATPPLVLTLSGTVLIGSIDLAAIPAKTAVQKGGSLVGTRNAINLIDGVGVSMTVTDNPGSDRVDITVDSPIVVEQAGSAVGSRAAINLIDGANVDMTVADNPGSNRVDITVAAKTTVNNDYSTVATRSAVNFQGYGGTALTVTDVPGGDYVDIHVTSPVIGPGTERTLAAWSSADPTIPLVDSFVSEGIDYTRIGFTPIQSVSSALILKHGVDPIIGECVRVYPQVTDGVSAVVCPLRLEAQSAVPSFLTLGPAGATLLAPAALIDTPGLVEITNLPTFANNAAALGGGLAVDHLYRTATGVLMITYTP